MDRREVYETFTPTRPDADRDRRVAIELNI
jgi:hypothetical protein